MIAQHGYTILNEDNKLIFDPAHEGEDEGIIYVIDGDRTKIHHPIYLDYAIRDGEIDPSLVAKIRPSNVETPSIPTFKTHSLGCMVAAAGYEEYLDDSRSFYHEYIQYFGHEVIYVILRYKNTERYGSIIADTPEGIFVFPDSTPEFDFGMDDFVGSLKAPILGKKINPDTSLIDLDGILHHYYPFDDVFYRSKRPTRRIEYSDVFITTIDE
jgi:hypothetical protein